eukprot:8705441-Pyramimonas_sp.AAC.1
MGLTAGPRALLTHCGGAPPLEQQTRKRLLWRGRPQDLLDRLVQLRLLHRRPGPDLLLLAPGLLDRLLQGR